MYKKFLALFCSGLFLAPAAASSDINPAYLDLQVHYANVAYSLSDLSQGLRARSVSTSGVNFHLALGYQLTKAWAAELGVLWANRATYRVGNQDFKVKHNVLYIAAKYGFYVSPRWEIYAKGGVGSVARHGFSISGVEALSSALIETPVLGAGILYHINPHWSLDASVMEALPQNSQKLPAAIFAGIGARYQFTF